jgi:hypothetical protein
MGDRRSSDIRTTAGRTNRPKLVSHQEEAADGEEVANHARSQREEVDLQSTIGC